MIKPEGASELLSGLGLALCAAHLAGTLSEWEPPLRSMICTVYLESHTYPRVGLGIKQADQLKKFEKVQRKTPIQHAIAISELLPQVEPKGRSSTNKQVADFFARTEYADKTWHDQRRISTYKTIDRFYVQDQDISKIMNRLLLFHGGKALHDSAIKLESVTAAVNEDRSDLRTFLELTEIGLKRKSLDIDKLVNAALKGRPERGDIALPILLLVREKTGKWLCERFRFSSVIIDKFMTFKAYDI